MKNNLLAFTLISIGSFLLLQIMNWYWVFILSFLVVLLIKVSKRSGIWIPFFAMLLLYLISAGLQNAQNNGIMGDVVAGLLQIGNSWIVLVVGSLIFALLAAWSGYCGFLLRDAFTPSEAKAKI